MSIEFIALWAAILSPIIAVLLAWWTSRSSSRAAKKQIKAMKELQKIQINLLQLQLDKDLSESQLRHTQTNRKIDHTREYNRFNNQIGGFADSMRHIDERNQDMMSEIEYQSERMKWLQYFQKRLDEMKRNIS